MYVLQPIISLFGINTMQLFKIFLEKIDLMLTERNSNSKYISWSSTKIGIFFFLYPVSSFCLIYDTYLNTHLDWMNLAVYAIAIVSPRALSNLVSVKVTGVGTSIAVKEELTE